jgi:glycosyltransferase involved in cell wall biosynthesis
MKPICSIIIRAYNEEKHIGRLLEGISQQTVKDIQIILVDSGSTDATVAIASRDNVDVVYIKPEEFTFGRSLNIGIAQAKADLVVMASAHVYPVYPDWLEKLIAPFEEDRVAVAYGKQRGMATTKYSEHQIFRHWFPDKASLRQDHPFCNNANSAIRKALWDNNPYDESLTGLEDLAWATWARSEGFYVSYVPEAEIIHVHDESWKGISNRYRREAIAFKNIYPDAKFGLHDLIRLWTTNVLSDMRIASQEKKLGKVWREIVRFRWMQFWGTYRGYHESGSLTWKLKQTFYYPNADMVKYSQPRRDVTPIVYNDEYSKND